MSMKRTLSAALLLVSTGVLAAQAAPAPADRAMAAAATPSARVQAASAEVTDESDGLNCGKSRKRLWVEGEGWVVRKVTTCH